VPTPTFLKLPAAKQERVLAAAVHEFSQRNVEQAVISNIVKQAGIPRGSFYQYFANKEDLYVYMFETLRARRREYTRPAFESFKKEPFLTFFERFYQLDTQFLFQHPQHIDLGKIMYSHAYGVSRGLIDAVQRRYRDIFLVAITHDQDLGRIRKDVDARAVADLCVHFMTDIFIFQNFSRRMSLPALEEHMRGILNVIRHGIE